MEPRCFNVWRDSPSGYVLDARGSSKSEVRAIERAFAWQRLGVHALVMHAGITPRDVTGPVPVNVVEVEASGYQVPPEDRS